MSDVDAIQTDGLGHRFGNRWALAHVSITISRGDTVLLAGDNGSGKTTLLRCLAGLHRPSSGTISIFGQDPVANRTVVRNQLSLISHHHYLYRRLTALETLQLWSDILGRDGSTDELLQLLDSVELDRHAGELVGGFSAGMKKRLNLLRWRLEDPRIALLDEPFTALDPSGQRLVRDWIRTFVRDHRGTVVIASHNLELCRELCQQALVLRQGQVAWQGPANDAAAQLRGRQVS